jgi:hypothetical protein
MILSHDMNLAFREDKKDTTRRLNGLGAVNVNPDQWNFIGIAGHKNHLDQSLAVFVHKQEDRMLEIPCPYGHVGTVCWIKEAYKRERTYPNAQDHSPNYKKTHAIYKTDKAPHVQKLIKWSAPRTMPRIYARSFVEIAQLRIQRLQEITNVEAIDEGMLTLPDDVILDLFPEFAREWREWSAHPDYLSVAPPIGPSPRERFAAIINRLHKPDTFARNCWAWVVKFKRLHDYEQRTHNRTSARAGSDSQPVD